MVQSSKSEIQWLWHKLPMEPSDSSAFPLPSLLPLATQGEAALLFALVVLFPHAGSEDINELEQLQSGGHSLSCWLCFKLDFFFSKEYLQPLCPLLCSSSSPTVSAWCGTIITKITGSFFFLADEWAEAGDVLAWPLSSSPSPL